MKLDTETQEVVREIRQKVDEAKISLSSNRSRGKVLDALMQQKKTGTIPGILGRLVKNGCSAVVELDVFFLLQESRRPYLRYSSQMNNCRETSAP